MKTMTEAEYDALDEHWSHNVPQLGQNGTGFFSRREAALLGLDDLSADYILTKARATEKSPAQIVNEIIHQQIAVA